LILAGVAQRLVTFLRSPRKSKISVEANLLYLFAHPVVLFFFSMIGQDEQD
jgi:hypothetical protein